MHELSGIGIIAAFLAGATSFLSPCVLPLVPSYVAGRTAEGIEPGRLEGRRVPAAGLGVCFVLGLSTVFVILGASATALAR